MFPDQFAGFAIKRLYDIAGVDQINNAVIDQRSWFGIPFVHIPDPFKGQVAHIFLVDLIKRAVRMRIVITPMHRPVIWAGIAQHGIGQGHKWNEVFGVACHRQSFGSGRFSALTPGYHRRNIIGNFKIGLRRKGGDDAVDAILTEDVCNEV